MCDPLLAVGAAATLGGTVLQMKAQNDANNANDAAIAAEQARQRTMENRENTLIKNNLTNTYGNVPADLDKAKAQRDALYASVLPPNAPTGSAPYTPGAVPAPSVIGRDAASRNASSSAATANSADAKARLAAFGDMVFGNDLATRNTDLAIGSINNARNRSLNILPLEQQAAELKARSPLADILTGVGGIGLQAGANNLFAAPSVGAPAISKTAGVRNQLTGAFQNASLVPLRANPSIWSLS